MRPHENSISGKKPSTSLLRYTKSPRAFQKEEKFGLTSQLRRASVSIVANISEGAARQTRKEFRQFLSHSQGSASEVDTELTISFRLNYLTRDDFRKLTDDLDHIGRMITRLSQSLVIK